MTEVKNVGQGNSTPAEPAAQTSNREASLWADTFRSLLRNPLFVISAGILLVMVIMAFFPQLFAHQNPQDCQLSRTRQTPSAEHWFGTDVQGCDYYTRVIYGAANSLAVGVLVSVSILVVGIVFGLVAAYYGRWIDAILMRVTDLVFAIPFILGALVFLAVQEQRNIWDVTLILAIFTWPTMARLMRSSVLAIINNDYVTAARAMGARPWTIMLRHILPNSLGPVVGYTAVFTGIVIGAEATLTFLGVGLQLPAISWGLQLNGAQAYLQQFPHLLIFPLIFVALTVFSFTTMGEALRDALDPKSKKR